MITGKYLLDANIFIEAHRRYYAFDIAPKFWTELNRHSASGAIASIDKVKEELLKGKDTLADWVKQTNFAVFHKVDDQATLEEYANLMQWANTNERFFAAAKAEFAKAADGWLVAYAKANSCIVVTQESLNKEARSRVKIPDACVHIGVEYIDTYTLLRRFKIKFE